MRAWILIATLTLVGCGDVKSNNGTDGGGSDASESDGGSTSDHYQYVVSAMAVPMDSAEAEAYGMDIDGDGTVDNGVGQAMVAVRSAGSDPQFTVDRAIATGELIMLLDVVTPSLSSAADVGVWWLRGSNPLPPPCTSPNDTVCGQHLSGGASFSVATSNTSDALLSGEIAGGMLQAGPNPRPVEIGVPLAFSGAVVTLPLVSARLEVASVATATLDDGRMAGAILDADIQNIYVPALAADASTFLADSTCTSSGGMCSCPAGSPAQTTADLFDTNGDCIVTAAELQTNNLIASLLAPDVDLFDSNGAFNPRVDGVNDSLSLGYRFFAVGASFTSP